MTKEELKDKITELKETCKKLAEEYRERYNQDNEDKIALNMFYHNVISYNDYESVLALFENRNSMIMCFSAPPVLTEETVEINLKRIEELEKENAELKEQLAQVKEIIETVLDKWKEEKWILQSEKEVRQVETLMKQAGQFLQEIEK